MVEVSWVPWVARFGRPTRVRAPRQQSLSQSRDRLLAPREDRAKTRRRPKNRPNSP